MATEVAANRTDVLVTDVHPCYQIEDLRYVLTTTPSFICTLLYMFLASLSVVTICGNLLVIISIIYFRHLHTPTNNLILSLAVADLLVGIIVFPLSMAYSLSSCLHYEDLFCKIRGSFDISLSTCSILNLCCISIDRYYAVCHPLTYRTKINSCVVMTMILLSWGVSALIGIGVIIAGISSEECDEKCLIDVLMENTIGPILAFYLPVIIILCIYLKIFLVAHKQASNIQNAKSTINVSKIESKATKTLAIVLGFFLICWSPFFLCITFLPFITETVPVPVIETLNWLTLANSMLNPFIYAFFYSWFRSAYKIIISGKIFAGDYTNSALR